MIIECACGCGGKLEDHDKYGRKRMFIVPHHLRMYAKDPRRGKRISEGLLGKHVGMLGKKHSEQTKKKMSASSIGRKKSNEHRENLSRSHIGKKLILSEEQKRQRGEKWKGDNNPSRHMTEIHRGNLKSAALKRYTHGRRTFSKPHKLFVQLFKDKFGIDLEIEFRLVTNSGRTRFYDCKIPNQSILFEIDGSFWHSRPSAMERDREKDALAERLGYTLYRVPAEKVVDVISLWPQDKFCFVDLPLKTASQAQEVQ